MPVERKIPDLSIVTVACNSGQALVEWANKWSGTAREIIIVDNGSTDGVPQFLETDQNGISVIRNSSNMGYGAAVNQAALKASCNFLLITNPDVYPAGENDLLMLLKNFPETGSALISGGLTGKDGNLRSTGGRWPSILWVFCQVFGSTIDLSMNSEPDWLQGAILLTKRMDFIRLGGFDEDFFLYFEDVDLCTRALRAGWKIKQIKEAIFLHYEGQGATENISIRLCGYHLGLYLYFRKHMGILAGVIVKLLLLLKCIIRIPVFIVLRGKKERMKGYLETLLILSGLKKFSVQ